MKKKTLNLTLLCILMLGIVQLGTFTTSAQSGGWVRENEVYWKYKQICKDGAILQAYVAPAFLESFPTDILPVESKDIGVYLLNDHFYSDDSTKVDLIYHTFLDRTVFYLDEGIRDDIPTNINDEKIVRWGRNLEIGDEVLFTNYERIVDTTATMEVTPDHIGTYQSSCSIFTQDVEADATKLDRAETYFNDPNHLNFDGQLTYSINSLSADGLIEIGGASAEIGNQFTFEDIQEGQVKLTRSESDQSVGFSVKGTARVSSNEGVQALGGHSSQPVISADGHIIAFTSAATNLDGSVTDDNSTTDIFVRTFITQTRTSPLLPTGTHHMSIGESVIFSFPTPFSTITPGDMSSLNPDISPSGQTLVFNSKAENIYRLADGCDGATEAPESFQVYSLNIQDRFEKMRNSLIRSDENCTELTTFNNWNPSVSEVGDVSFHTFVALPNNLVDFDNNNSADVLLNSASISTSNTQVLSFTTLFDQTTTGSEGSFVPDVSDDGQWVVFETDNVNFDLSSNYINEFTDIVITTNPPGPVINDYVSVNSAGEVADGGHSLNPRVSRFGDHVVFDSTATNLYSGGTTSGERHVYIHDRKVKVAETAGGDPIYRTDGCTLLMSKSAAGLSQMGPSSHPSVSADGRFVAFQSTDNFLVDGDTNNASDIFVVDRDADEDGSFYTNPSTCIAGPSRIFRVSRASDGTQGNAASTEADISANGEFVAFRSAATNLVPDDTNNFDDIFVHYIGYTGTITIPATDPEPAETPTPIPTATPDPSLLPYKAYLPIIIR